jgi:hypothetical protein
MALLLRPNKGMSMSKVDQVDASSMGPAVKSQSGEGQNFAEVLRDRKRPPSADVGYPRIKSRTSGGDTATRRVPTDLGLKLSPPLSREAGVATCSGSRLVHKAAAPIGRGLLPASDSKPVDGYPDIRNRNAGKVLQSWGDAIGTFARDFFKGKMISRETIGMPRKPAMLAGAGLVLVSVGAAYYWYNHISGQYIPVDPGNDATQPVATAQTPRPRAMSV